MASDSSKRTGLGWQIHQVDEYVSESKHRREKAGKSKQRFDLLCVGCWTCRLKSVTHVWTWHFKIYLRGICVNSPPRLFLRIQSNTRDTGLILLFIFTVSAYRIVMLSVGLLCYQSCTLAPQRVCPLFSRQHILERFPQQRSGHGAQDRRRECAESCAVVTAQPRPRS